MPCYLGLDLGGTGIKTAVVDDQGRVLSKSSAPTPGDRGPDAVMDQMVKLGAAVVSEAGLAMGQIDAVGIGAPGQIDFEQGVLASAPNLPLLTKVPVRDRIAQATGRPTVLENDANAAAFGEYWAGAGRDPSIRHLVVLTLGTGVGGGVILDGQIVHGGFGNGGEAGHMIMVADGPLCGCGQHGCLEVYASASYVARRAIEAIQAGQRSVLDQIHQADGKSVTAKDVFEAAKAGDALAGRVAGEAATFLGLACVSLCRLLDPQMIVMAGGMIQAGDYLLERVREAFVSHDWKMAERAVEIAPAQLGPDAGVIGSAAVACDAHEKGRLA